MGQRIVFLTHYSALYGANISLLEYLRNSQIPKSQMVVIAPYQGSLTEKLEEEGIEYCIQWFPYNTAQKGISICRRYWNALKKIKYLYHLFLKIKEIRPALIYTNSSVLYYGVFIARLLNIPHIWHLREFGFLDYGLVPDFGFRFQKYFIKKSDYSIAISEAVAKHYKITHNKSNIIFNGVTTNHQLCKLNSYIEPLKFGIVGIITEYKNQFKLLKAFHQFNKGADNNAILYIIGNGGGSYYESIQEYIITHSLSDNVKLVGHISGREDIYNLFDIILNGAEYEGFGRVTVEAMSFGKIPIGYNHSGTAEIIKHNITGLLFDDFEKLPLLLHEINENRGLLRKLQKSMIENFDERFTLQYYSKAIDNVVLKSIKKNEF